MCSGLSPVQGRLLVDSDDRTEASPAVVISDSLWKRRFDGIARRHWTAACHQRRVIHGRWSRFPIVSRNRARSAVRRTYTFRWRRGVSSVASGDPNDPNFWWVLLMGRIKPGSDPERVRGTTRPRRQADSPAARPEIADKDLPRVEAFSGASGQLQVRDRTREPLKMMSIVVGDRAARRVRKCRESAAGERPGARPRAERAYRAGSTEASRRSTAAHRGGDPRRLRKRARTAGARGGLPERCCRHSATAGIR